MTAPAGPDLIFAIAPEIGVPRYQQLQTQLRMMIDSGALRAGKAIPSERELMRRTGLSRMTVRQAVAELTHEGLLRRDHGRGTFVVPPVVQQEVQGVYSFSDRVRAQGRVPSTRVLLAERIPASDEQATTLALSPGAPLFRLVRLRLVDDFPTMLDVTLLPAQAFPGLLEHDLTGSLYAILAARYAQRPVRSTDTLEAIAAPEEVASALEVHSGEPLILMRRLALSADGQPIELTEEYGRPDRCRYRISLVSEPPFIELTESGDFVQPSSQQKGHAS